MTLIPYKISDTCRRTARLSGFDIDNPNMRHPVQNPMMEKVLHERGRPRPHDPRAKLLLKGREALTRIIKRER